MGEPVTTRQERIDQAVRRVVETLRPPREELVALVNGDAVITSGAYHRICAELELPAPFVVHDLG